MNDMEKLLIAFEFGQENLEKKYEIFQELKVGVENLFENYDEKDFEYVLGCSRLLLDIIEDNFNQDDSSL